MNSYYLLCNQYESKFLYQSLSFFFTHSLLLSFSLQENTLESNQLFGSNGIKKEEPLEEEEEKFSESLNSHRTKPPSLFRGIGNRGDDHLAHQAPEVVKPPVEPSPQAPVSSGPPRYKLTLLGRRN